MRVNPRALTHVLLVCFLAAFQLSASAQQSTTAAPAQRPTPETEMNAALAAAKLVARLVAVELIHLRIQALLNDAADVRWFPSLDVRAELG